MGNDMNAGDLSCIRMTVYSGGFHMGKRLRVLAVALAVSFVLPLSACGRKKPSGRIVEQDSPTWIKEEDPYFRSEMKELVIPTDPEKELESMGVNRCRIIGETVLLEYRIHYKIPRDVDMSSMQDYTVSGQALYDLAGNQISELKASGFENMVSATLDKDGNPYCLVDVPDSDFEHHKVLRKLENGDWKDITVLPDLAETYFDVSLQITEDGLIIIGYSGNLKVYSDKGDKICSISDPGRTLSSCVYQVNGKNYVLSRNPSFDESPDPRFKEVDLKSGSLGTGYKAPALARGTTVTCVGNSVYAMYRSKVVKLDIESGAAEEVFDWNDTDIDLSLLRGASCFPKNDDEFYFAYTEFVDVDNSRAYIGMAKRAEKNPHAGKAIITIGMPYLEQEITKWVSQYNSDMTRHSRISLICYEEQMISEGKDPEEVRLPEYIRMEFLSGRIPDILMGLETEGGFRSDNLLVDLAPYIDSEGGLDRSLYYDNILRAMEKDGKLFFMPITYGIDTLIVNDHFIPKDTDWTYEGFLETGRNLDSGVSFYPTTLKSELLRMLFRSAGGGFIDYEEKTVRFDNEDFYTMLQIADTFGVEKIPEEEQMTVAYLDDGSALLTNESYISHEDRFSEEILAVKESFLPSMLMFGTEKALLNDQSSFHGYPGRKGEGNAVFCMVSMGITSESKNKNEAWNVIRSFLEKDAQEQLCIEYGLPIRRESFRAVSEAQVKSIQKEREDLIKEGFTESLMLSQIAPKVEMDDIDELEEQILKIDRVFEGDSAIEEIVIEEAGGYFAGSRTKEDTAKNINNRANILMKERG